MGMKTLILLPPDIFTTFLDPTWIINKIDPAVFKCKVNKGFYIHIDEISFYVNLNSAEKI